MASFDRYEEALKLAEGNDDLRGWDWEGIERVSIDDMQDEIWGDSSPVTSYEAVPLERRTSARDWIRYALEAQRRCESNHANQPSR